MDLIKKKIKKNKIDFNIIYNSNIIKKLLIISSKNMKTMTANVMKKFLKKLPKDIENIIKDNIRDILCLNVVPKSQKEVINQLKELFYTADETLCEHYVCEGYDDLDEVYDLLMEKHLKEYIFEVLDDFKHSTPHQHCNINLVSREREIHEKQSFYKNQRNGFEEEEESDHPEYAEVIVEREQDEQTHVTRLNGVMICGFIRQNDAEVVSSNLLSMLTEYVGDE